MKLGVNIDHVATLRQARGGRYPDPAQASLIVQRAGADSVVMHLREDRRHIQDADLFNVKEVIRIKLNLEMSVASSVVKTALRLRPEQATLVPENRRERTTEGGLNLFKKNTAVCRVIDALKAKNILVSLFIDPDLRQVERARRAGADAIELHTGDYANAAGARVIAHELKRLNRAVEHGRESGLVTHAGHGLDYKNVGAIKKIKGIEELNIGYAIITRALDVGLDSAVREMKAKIA